MKISTVTELRSVLDKFVEAHKVISSEDCKQSFFDLASAKAERRNRVYATLPAKIEISAELANFIITDEIAHLSRAEKFEREKKPLKNSLTLVGHMMGLLLSPTTGGHSAPYHFIRIQEKLMKMEALDKEYGKILDQRNQIARETLSRYLLAQNEKGDFELRIGQWQWTQASVSQLLSYDNIGLDKSIDKSKLGTLPPSNIRSR